MSRSASVPTNPPWVQVRTVARHADITQIEFRFTPAHIQRVLNRSPQTLRQTTRGDWFETESERLLLEDVTHIDGTTVFVTAWLIAAAEPETFHIHVKIGAPEYIRRNVSIILYWDRAQYVATLRAGIAEFEDISPPTYSRRNNTVPPRHVRLKIQYDGSDDGSNGKH